MLQEQKAVYETLLNPNADLPSNSRRPRLFIGIVEHFLTSSQVREYPSTSRPWRTTDRITVYQHSDSERACAPRNIAGVGHPPPCPGTTIPPQQTYYAETCWSDDGVPTTCNPIESTVNPPQLQRVGLCLVAMPSGRNGTDGYEVSASHVAPVVHCSSPNTRHAREACAISAMVEEMKQKTSVDATDTMNNDDEAEYSNEDKSSSTSGGDSSQESSSNDSSPLSHPQPLHDPSTWVFPPSNDDPDEDTWSTGEDGPEYHLQTGIEEDPSMWVFPEDDDSGDDSWSSDEEE